MLTSEDLEALIASKKREIEREKTLLGLSLPHNDSTTEDKENGHPESLNKQVTFKSPREDEKKQVKCKVILSDQQHEISTTKDNNYDTRYRDEEKIPPDLERYIRRYIGIPAMLKAGEYSPNNPLLREAERARGSDVLLGLGEYERRRNTLRKYRQAQYREYLDQQAKKKQEAKEQAERERQEREEQERLREERQRQLLLERERYSPERRRASVTSVPISNAFVQTTKVDTGVQVEGLSSPLSVAVQTDDIELYQLPPSPLKWVTEAERELSPRAADEPRERWGARRRSHGDYDEHTSTLKKTNREKLVSDLRHSYMPSIFDADAIQMRNLQAEKEAAARRQFYQQELKNQILEQQRIREERKSREKMLEQAEMRRLEEQLRMLRVAQEREMDKQHDLSIAMKENTKDYDTKRAELQKEIDIEKQKILRATSQPSRNLPKRVTNTSQSDTTLSKLPFYYPNKKAYQLIEKDKKPYSFNIPDNSVFSSNYDVDSYLRKNLNFRDKMELNIENIGSNVKSLEKYPERNNSERDKDFKRDTRYEDAKRNFERNKEAANIKDIERNKNIENIKDLQNNKDSERTFKYKDIERNTDFESNKDVERNLKYKDTERDFERTSKYKDIERNTDFESNKDVERNLKYKDTERDRDIERNTRNKEFERTVVVEKALIHEHKEKQENRQNDLDKISIPILRHSPDTQQITKEPTTKLSEAMKKIDDKWKVPAVQKNILKSLPNEDGKNISILTQLGSIRKQLQLEQLKLDRMLTKDES